MGASYLLKKPLPTVDFSHYLLHATYIKIAFELQHTTMHKLRMPDLQMHELGMHELQMHKLQVRELQIYQL